MLGVITDQFLQPLDLRKYLRFGHRVRVKKMLIAGNQKPAHAGFQINCQPDRFIGVADDTIAVLDPFKD